MYISRVRLKNIKPFHDIDLQFDLSHSHLPWTMLLGDNATGKTALLRAIAIGLCDESSAAGLMKESDEGYIRRGSKSNGEIHIELQRRLKSRTTYSVTTTIERVRTRHGSFERLRQTVSPTRAFPRAEIFACAYGAGRGTAGTGDISGYTLINAVYNLFNYSEGLQNPELTIRRLKRLDARSTLKAVLAKFTHVKRVNITDSGIVVDGKWGRRMPLRDLADGYRSAMLWLTDFLGWAIAFDPTLTSPSKLKGIVLLDELEQHLHPRWQETIVGDLRRLFPQVQFISSTHSPLIAASVGSLRPERSADQIFHFAMTPSHRIACRSIAYLRGMRIDQVLASPAFDYIITTHPDIRSELRRLSSIAGRSKPLSGKAAEEYRRLKEKVARTMISKPQTRIERQIQDQFLAFARERTKSLEAELFGKEQ